MLARITQHAITGARSPIISRAQMVPRHVPAPGTFQLARTARTRSAQTPNRALSRSAQQSSSQSRRIPSHRPALPSTPFTQSLRRPFTSGPRFNYNYNQYNRFNGPRRGSLFYTLVQNAKPRHFVIIGLGASGVYLYNTDVVTVRRHSFNLPTKKRYCLTYQYPRNRKPVDAALSSSLRSRN